MRAVATTACTAAGAAFDGRDRPPRRFDARGARETPRAGDGVFIMTRLERATLWLYRHLARAFPDDFRDGYGGG